MKDSISVSRRAFIKFLGGSGLFVFLPNILFGCAKSAFFNKDANIIIGGGKCQVRQNRQVGVDAGRRCNLKQLPTPTPPSPHRSRKYLKNNNIEH